MSSVIKPVSDIETALTQLGVKENTLTVAQKTALDQQGYLIIPGIISTGWLKELREAFEDAMRQQEAKAGKFGKQEQGTRHVGELVGKHPAFEGIYSSAELLAGVYHILKRDFRLTSFTGRDPLPGYGQQGLHADWAMPPRWDGFDLVNSIWLLDDFNQQSGGTGVVPGSHLIHDPLPKNLRQPDSRHPNEIQIIAPAGSLLIFNAHLWHRGVQNHSQPHRRGLFAMFRGSDAQYYNTGNEPKPDFAPNANLSPAVRYIMGL